MSIFNNRRRYHCITCEARDISWTDIDLTWMAFAARLSERLDPDLQPESEGDA